MPFPVFGSYKQPQREPEPEPERALTAEEEIYARRYLRLLALHIEPADAISLIDIPDVAHDAEQLYDKGCPPHLIVELLKGD